MASFPPEWMQAAVGITCGFEVSGDPYAGVSGNFDKMGISCGALQWNIGSGSLQPLVIAAGQAVVTRTMPTVGDEMWKACNTTVPKGLAIVNAWQTGSKLKAKPRAELVALMSSPEMRKQQDVKIGKVADRAMTLATTWMKGSGEQPGKRLFCLMFDLATQNGGLGGVERKNVLDFIELNTPGKADDVVCDFLAAMKGNSGHVKDAHENAKAWRDKATGDKLETLVLAYLRSALSKPEWRHVVLNRKGSIAMGGGYVNSGKVDFSKWGL